MALKFFLVLTGIMLGSSVSLLALMRQLAPKAVTAAGKRPMIYGVIAGMLAALCAWAITLAVTDPYPAFWVLALFYLLFGGVHVGMMHRRFLPDEPEDRSKAIGSEYIFAAAVCLFSLTLFACLVYFVTDRNYFFYPVLLAGLAFFIPLLFQHTFEAAIQIPAAQFVTWQYPLGRPLDPPEEKENERLLVIGFEIAKKDSDAKKTYFRARAPEDIRLGELFYHFINDYNDLHSETPIRYLAREEAPYPWWFRRKPKWFQGQRILDPEQTIRDNGIRENTVIICERLAAAG